jgi:peptide/nickel transport system permease protein
MRLSRLRRPEVTIGLALVALLVGCAIAPGWLAPHDPTRIVAKLKFLPPAWVDGGRRDFLLGTDQLGRDLLSRLIYGARTSLMIAVSAVALAASTGIALGLVAGYFGGWVGSVVMRLADVQLAFPFILLALSILSVTEHKAAATVILVLAVADWVVHARVARGRVLVEREKEYVRGAWALGASHLRTMVVYILPAVLPTAIVIAMIELAVLMLVESILSFIGLGIDPPAVSWGTILADGRRNVAIAWWMLLFPGAAIFLAVLAVNLLADGLADLLDPRLRIAGRMTRRFRAPARFAAGPRSSPAEDSATLLRIEKLRVVFPTSDGPPLRAVEEVSFTLKRGERLGIVGESGSGKSVTALSIMGLLDANGHIAGGSIRLKGRELVGLRHRVLDRIRGREMAMIFQDPGVALNPVYKIGWQIAEAIALHQDVGSAEAHRRAIEALASVNIPEPVRVAASYPFEISGGMQQRAMIAMALSCRPDLLIADEPTTALDVTTQAQILRELDGLVTALGTGVILISHNLGVVAEFTDHTVVMYAGIVCEAGPTGRIVVDPLHPYTQLLLAAVRQLEGDRTAAAARGEPLDPRDRPPGCPFAPRCPVVRERCREAMPELVAHAGRSVACHAVDRREARSHEPVAH